MIFGKQRVVFTEGSWNFRSSEVLADLAFLLIPFLYFMGIVIFNPSVFFFPSLTMIGLGVGFYIYLRKVGIKIYALSYSFQLLLVLWIAPIPFLHPVALLLSFLSGAFLYSFAVQSLQIRLESTYYILFFLFLWESLLAALGFQWGKNPSTLEVPFLGLVSTESLGPLFARPWVKLPNIEYSRVLVEFCGAYSLVLVALCSLRKPILWLGTLFWFGSFALFFLGKGEFPLPWIISYASLAFFLQTGPGRNHYGNFFPGLALNFLFLPLAWIYGKFGFSPLALLFSFFPLYAIGVRVFLGK